MFDEDNHLAVQPMLFNLQREIQSFTENLYYLVPQSSGLLSISRQGQSRRLATKRTVSFWVLSNSSHLSTQSPTFPH